MYFIHLALFTFVLPQRHGFVIIRPVSTPIVKGLFRIIIYYATCVLPLQSITNFLQSHFLNILHIQRSPQVSQMMGEYPRNRSVLISHFRFPTRYFTFVLSTIDVIVLSYFIHHRAVFKIDHQT